MTKTFNFYTKNNSNNSNKKNIFLGNTDYSSILDDIITADIIKKNSYLFNHSTSEDILDDLFDDDPIILTGSKLKVSDDFTKAANFLANYKKYKKTYKIPYIIGKMYTLSDGTPIVFYDDEIQIGFDTIKYSKFNDLSFLKNLTAPTKKTIINIYTFGAANININLL
jgi:hypothetical protein